MIKLRMAADMAAVLLFASLAYGELSCDLSQAGFFEQPADRGSDEPMKRKR